MEHAVRTMEDLSMLLQSCPKFGVIKASPCAKEIFTVLGKLANWKLARLSRFICNGCISLDSDHIYLGVRAGKGLMVQRLDIVYECDGKYKSGT
jgi:hypothetical protein